jgi:hypothetical protein
MMTTFRIGLWVKVQISTGGRPHSGKVGRLLHGKRAMRKTLIGLMLAGFLAGGAVAADVIVRVSPPRPVIEERIVRPSPRHVWITGYHRYDGRAYVWVPGRWEVPPRARARWVGHHWVRRRGGWVLVDGRWR